MGTLSGGPIPPCLDREASLLLSTSQGKKVVMFFKTSTWPVEVSGPCDPQGRKDIVVGECCESESLEWCLQVEEVGNQVYFPLDDIP